MSSVDFVLCFVPFLISVLRRLVFVCSNQSLVQFRVQALSGISCMSRGFCKPHFGRTFRWLSEVNGLLQVRMFARLLSWLSMSTRHPCRCFVQLVTVKGPSPRRGVLNKFDLRLGGYFKFLIENQMCLSQKGGPGVKCLPC